MIQDLDFCQLSKRHECPKCGACFPESTKKEYKSDGENEWLEVMCVHCEFKWLEHILSTTDEEKAGVELKLKGNFPSKSSPNKVPHDFSVSEKSYW